MDKDEFARAYKKGFSMTYRFLMTRGVSDSDAEEMSQIAWATAWEHREDLRIPSSIVVWANSIAKHAYINYVRKNELITKLRRSKDSYTLQTSDLKRLVEQVSVCLTEKEKQIAYLVYWEDCTSEEVASKMGIEAVTVRVRLVRIRRKIRKVLAAHCIPLK